MLDRIYIAATSQHVGKTTSTLGLMAAIRDLGYNVGYCKPVGQEFVDLGDLRVDKDALLFSTTMGFDLKAEWHSPVIIGRGLTAAYLDDPTLFDFPSQVLAASKALQEKHDIVVYEGTGHPGVGSVIDLSNADVAALLGAPVIMVVEGGIGSTIDRLNTNLALFREKDVPVIGVILNKTLPAKREKVQRYVGEFLKKWGIPLLGTLPYDRSLANPIMESIVEAVGGQVILNGHRLDNRVENFASGSLIENHEFDDLRNLLIIVSYRRLEQTVESLKVIARRNRIKGTPLAGIVMNGEHNFIPELLDNFPCLDYILEHEIPIVATQLDTYGSAIKINQMEVKINIRTPWKAQRAIEMIRDNVSLREVFEG